MGIKGVWVTCRIKRLDPEGGEGQRSAILTRRLPPPRGPDFPGECGCIFTDKPSGSEDNPHYIRHPHSACVEIGDRNPEMERGQPPASGTAEAPQAVLWGRGDPLSTL